MASPAQAPAKTIQGLACFSRSSTILALSSLGPPALRHYWPRARGRWSAALLLQRAAVQPRNSKHLLGTLQPARSQMHSSFAWVTQSKTNFVEESWAFISCPSQLRALWHWKSHLGFVAAL